MFVLLLSTLVCCQPTELILGFLFHKLSNLPPPPTSSSKQTVVMVGAFTAEKSVFLSEEVLPVNFVIFWLGQRQSFTFKFWRNKQKLFFFLHICPCEISRIYRGFTEDLSRIYWGFIEFGLFWKPKLKLENWWGDIKHSISKLTSKGPDTDIELYLWSIVSGLITVMI